MIAERCQSDHVWTFDGTPTRIVSGHNGCASADSAPPNDALFCLPQGNGANQRWRVTFVGNQQV